MIVKTHPQTKVYYPYYNTEIDVDEKIAPFLQLLWEKRIWTIMSCQDNPREGIGRVWISFNDSEHACNFLRRAVPHPDTSEFAVDSLYNRSYAHWAPDEWHKSNDIEQVIIERGLWQWSCHLSDFTYDSMEEKFDGPQDPSFAIDLRFPFSDLEQLTKNIKAS